VEFHVLGSVEVVEDGQRLMVASGRQLALLAFLVIHANRVVSTGRIIDELWGDEPPDSGAKTVAFHISRLRDALEPGRSRGSLNGVIATETAGYVLRVEPNLIDAVRFERLAAEGRALLPSDPDTARARLGEALALWHGEPYAGVADESFAQPEIRRLDELHLRAREDRLEADLALGRHADVIDELQALVAQEPLRERLRGQLMVALYRAGRQAEALRIYGEGRRVLGDELGIDPGPELQQLEGWILRQDPRLDPPARRRVVRNPYKGLRPFGEVDRPDFFGREALVARLVERLGDVARAGRLLVVVGPSGSGKSSAVRAGLIPALRAGTLAGSARWPIAVMQPGTRPLRELAAALGTVGAGAAGGLADRLDRDGDLAEGVARVLPDDVPHLVLVIDQLEELWSLVADDAERSGFVAAIVNALSARDARLLVVATLRADFLDRPLRCPGLGELVRAGTELVTPLTRDELERAIVRPAASVGVGLEPGLATEVIADVARQPGELPLLQYALTELFERSDGRRLTREAYAAVGGVLGALGRRAEDVYASLDAEGREVCRQAFLRLVVPGEAGEPTARRVARSELRTLADDQRPIDEALDAFGRGRLLSFDRDAVTGEPFVQVAHEALLARWTRLGGWIEEAREDLWTRRRLADAAADWIRSGRDPGYLLSGSRLALFASWAASTDLRLDLPERELLDASDTERRRLDEVAAAQIAHERALERRAATRLRALVAVLAIAALVATSLSVVVYGQGEAAREQGALAAARELAAASIGNLGTDPQLSLLLAWQAAAATSNRGYVVEEAMDALHWALQASHVAYPTSAALIAVRTSLSDPRGVMLLAPDLLMTLAATAAGRSLTPGECRTYLHREACPAAPAAPGPAVKDVYTALGIVPVERLVSGSLAGSRVDALSELPVDLAPLVAAFAGETGIDVTGATAADGDLEARIAVGDLPDVAIVSRPALVAELARAGLLVDQSGFVDVARLRAIAGDYLVRLGTVGTNGSWPAAEGRLYGAAFATEAESQVWYPKAAFERAGYAVPRSSADLAKLADAMVADGRTPWCLGVEAGSSSGGAAVRFVEETMLRSAGPIAYDAWANGDLPFIDLSVQASVQALGNLVFRDGYVLGGVASVLHTPEAIAAWPMFVDPPECWLHLAGGTDRVAWPAGGSSILAAFPFPAANPKYADEVRGRAFTVVVFHDRPEVRRFVGLLLGDQFAATATTSFAPAGIWPTGPPDPAVRLDEVTGREGERLRSAVRAGTFRVAASDLMPTRLAAAFAQATLTYLTWGDVSLNGVLGDLEEVRRGTR
jgi:DNA-binding SARP family transcriptional activator/ABC-type glycerol-3-phosphate transport system substrate-binding protein